MVILNDGVQQGASASSLAPVNSLCTICFICLWMKPCQCHLWKRRSRGEEKREGKERGGKRGRGGEREGRAEGEAELWCGPDGALSDPREHWVWDDPSELSPVVVRGLGLYSPTSLRHWRRGVAPSRWLSAETSHPWAAESWVRSASSTPAAGTASLVLCQCPPQRAAGKGRILFSWERRDLPLASLSRCASASSSPAGRSWISGQIPLRTSHCGSLHWQHHQLKICSTPSCLWFLCGSAIWVFALLLGPLAHQGLLWKGDLFKVTHG